MWGLTNKSGFLSCIRNAITLLSFKIFFFWQMLLKICNLFCIVINCHKQKSFIRKLIQKKWNESMDFAQTFWKVAHTVICSHNHRSFQMTSKHWAFTGDNYSVTLWHLWSNMKEQLAKGSIGCKLVAALRHIFKN